CSHLRDSVPEKDIDASEAEPDEPDEVAPMAATVRASGRLAATCKRARCDAAESTHRILATTVPAARRMDCAGAPNLRAGAVGLGAEDALRGSPAQVGVQA